MHDVEELKYVKYAVNFQFIDNYYLTLNCPALFKVWITKGNNQYGTLSIILMAKRYYITSLLTIEIRLGLKLIALTE